MGGYSNGTADLCGEHVNWMSRRTLLHEMAHGWVEATVSADLKARFLRLRQLETWSDHDVGWEERGTEHAAEIISWALDGQPTGMEQASIPRNDPAEHAAEIISWALFDQGIGTHLPSVPRNDPEQLAEAFELLTGRPIPELPAGGVTQD
jgi:hypothetical protein